MISRFGRWFVSNLDPTMLVLLALILTISLVNLFSAGNQSTSLLSNGLVNTGIGLTVMWVVSKIPPQTIMLGSLPIYVVGVLLLLGVHFHGETVNGATRWLDLGLVTIQPSEILKLGTPMMLAWYFQMRESTVRWWDFLVAALILSAPVALIIKQPDLGTAILVTAAGFYVLYFAGLSWMLLAAGVLATAAGVYAVTHWDLCIQILREYQCVRVATLMNPDDDPLNKGWHTLQGTIAIGAGGLMGKGWLKGTQTHLDFIPESHTDFAFAVFSEEWGLLGNGVLLLVYLLIIGRGLVIAAHAHMLFARLMAGAITLSFFTYCFVNMGMVAGILPVVGVPLPFVTYGGTALVTLMLGMGMLMSFQTHRTMMRR